MMIELSSAFLSLVDQISLKFAARKILIICFSIIFTIWFISPPTSYLQVPTPAHKPQAKFQQNCAPPNPFNGSKVALLIEDRPIPHLAPLLLHMISVVPPDWRFMFLGSPESIGFLNSSFSIQMQVLNGKLDMLHVPENLSVNGQEPLSQTLTNIWFWRWLGGNERWNWEHPYTKDGEIGPDGEQKWRTQVEWVLIFQTDSILCANSKISLNDWLHYDWVGAPWSIKDPYGGNGGLSLRRVSRIVQVLQFQHRYPGHYEMEDMWLIQRIGILPGARMANATTESKFSVEQVWSEEPMGYHLGRSGTLIPAGVWKDLKQRQKIWKWCPEIKLILKMELTVSDLESITKGGAKDNSGFRKGGHERVERERREIKGGSEWQRLKAW